MLLPTLSCCLHCVLLVVLTMQFSWLNLPSQSVERLRVTLFTAICSCVFQGHTHGLQRWHRRALSERLERFKEMLLCLLLPALKNRSLYNEKEMETGFTISSRMWTTLNEFQCARTPLNRGKTKTYEHFISPLKC